MYDPYGVPYPTDPSAVMGWPYDASGWSAEAYSSWGNQEQAAAAYDGNGWWGTGYDGLQPSSNVAPTAARPVGQKVSLAGALDSLVSASEAGPSAGAKDEGSTSLAQKEEAAIAAWQPQGACLPMSNLPPEVDYEALEAKMKWAKENENGKGARPSFKGAGKGGMDTPGRRPYEGGEETPLKGSYGATLKRDYWEAAKASGGTGRYDATPAKAARVAQQLRQLLDFYFEPFNLQHNRYLLDLLARKLGQPDVAGPWLSDALLDFRFTFHDLKGLGRIAAAMGKLRPSQWEAGDSGVLGNLKHLTWANSGNQLLLRQPPEVRSFVEGARTLHPEVVSSALRYLASTREHCGQAPAKMVSVFSYALSDILTDDSDKGQLSHGRLKRQLLLHNSDIICIQGLDPNSSGEGLTQTLVDEGYAYSTARIQGVEANTIFWDAGRWELLSREECGAALAVDLRPHEDQSVALRAICARPAVPTTTSPGLRSLFEGQQSRTGPTVVCADLTLLGGAEGASIIEELSDMRSVMMEVTGEELAAPLGTRLPEGGMAGVCAGASGLNKMHRPDSVLFAGMAPIVVLSGHTKRYLATLDSEELVQQFPAFRAPIVAAFDWHCGTSAVTEGDNLQ